MDRRKKKERGRDIVMAGRIEGEGRRREGEREGGESGRKSGRESWRMDRGWEGKKQQKGRGGGREGSKGWKEERDDRERKR